MGDKNYYNTILSQVFSPCGNYLIVGDIYGSITVFNLHKVLNPDNNNEELRKHTNTFVVDAGIQINSLVRTEKYLLVGTAGEITAYTWSQVKSSEEIKPAWHINVPSATDSFEKNDINCMIYNEKTEHLYAGCCDNNIYFINIETGEILKTLQGHDDYIHDMSLWGDELVSGAEDGLVMIWDVRTKNAVHNFLPSSNPKVERPELGNWIGAVDINDDWMICGGGARLSLWHFRSLSISTVFPINDNGIHVARFLDDRILAGGTARNFYHMNLNGDMVSEISTSGLTTYSAVYQKKPYEALCLAGSSQNIDICTNLNYRDQVLPVKIY